MTDLASYFDYAATAPMLPEAIEAYTAAVSDFPGNPSSLHDAGVAARRALATAKESMCHAAGFDDGRLLVTSGGTESNNLVIRGVLAKRPKGRILVAGDVHPSIWFAKDVFADRCDVVEASDNGRLTAKDIAAALTSDHVLVCLSHACNETGIAHGVQAISGLCQRREVLCLIDGTQALGHLPVDLSQLECDFYSFSAHKFGGPRGVGGLFFRHGDFTAQARGGNQEWELRAGTENVAGVVASARALVVSVDRLQAEAQRLRDLGTTLADGVRAVHPETLINSHLDTGLPGLVSLSVPGVNAHNMAVALNLHGFAVSTGSACHADQIEPSRVILSLGRTTEEALGTLRISFGPATTTESVAAFVPVLNECIAAEHVKEGVK